MVRSGPGDKAACDVCYSADSLQMVARGADLDAQSEPEGRDAGRIESMC